MAFHAKKEMKSSPATKYKLEFEMQFGAWKMTLSNVDCIQS